MCDKNVAVLSSLLKGELSAVETYTKSLHQLRDSDIRLELTELRLAHARRARQLRRRLRQLGARATTDAEAFEFPSVDNSLLTDQTLLTLLWDGEQRASAAYQGALRSLDSSSSDLFVEEVLPEQEVTHSVVFTLRSALELQEKIA